MTRVVLTSTKPLPRPQPTEAMLPCEEALSELPENFPELPVAEAINVLVANHIVDSTFFFECSRKHTDLVRWAEEVNTQDDSDSSES